MLNSILRATNHVNAHINYCSVLIIALICMISYSHNRCHIAADWKNNYQVLNSYDNFRE